MTLYVHFSKTQLCAAHHGLMEHNTGAIKQMFSFNQINLPVLFYMSERRHFAVHSPFQVPPIRKICLGFKPICIATSPFLLSSGCAKTIILEPKMKTRTGFFRLEKECAVGGIST